NLSQAPIGNPATQNPTENPTLTLLENLIPIQAKSLQPSQEVNVPAVDLLTDDVPDIKAGQTRLRMKHYKNQNGHLLEHKRSIINEEGKRVLKNTKVIGKWKDENGGDRAIGYAGVRAKCYSVVCENSRKNMIMAKGLKKSLIKKELSHKIFEDCV
ncbi:11079_t:CDS:2, partial [Acaulospora morrowiae]